MKTTALSLIAALAFGAGAIAAGVSDYQVTGNVTDVNDAMITVMKGKEKFEIARDSSTKADGEVKTGDKATVHYKMTAISIEAKAAKKDAKAAASPAASVKK